MSSANAPPPRLCPYLQALGMWSWCQWLCQKARTNGKVPLLINLDETSIPLEFTHARGNIIAKLSRQKLKSENLPKQTASRSAVRCFFTHVALICNDSAVQPLLPQVLFIAGNHLPWAVWSDIQRILPKNVFVRRQKSGWSNAEQHQIILRVLHLALGPVLAHMQPILSFDCAPIHLHGSTIGLLGELEIWWFLIPKKLTWLLQPLDTHAFMKYKRYIRKRWMDRLAARTGRRNVFDIVQIVLGAIRHVLQGHQWKNAFKENGIGEDSACTSRYIKNQLKWQELPPIVPAPPVQEMLATAWPLNRRLPLLQILTSLGLELPDPMPIAVGAAPPDSIMAGAGADEADVDESAHAADTCMAEASPISDDDIPLASL